MCLISNEANPSVAAEDIKCWKYVYKSIYSDDHFISLFEGYRYYPHKLNELSEVYKTLFLASKEKKNYGFHSYVNEKDVMEDTHKCYKIECVIPKGSLYWTGIHGFTQLTYCSNQIIVNTDVPPRVQQKENNDVELVIT